MDEFLNPKATVTPGVLGAFMMLLANTICQFFPEFPFRYVALILSFLIASITFSSVIQITIPKKILLWVLNALVIFSVGVGSTNIAANIESNGKEYVSIVSSAFAQNQNATINAPQNCTIVPPKPTPKPQLPAYDIYKDDKLKQQQFFKKW